RPGSRGVRADPRPDRHRGDRRPDLPGRPGQQDPEHRRQLGLVRARLSQQSQERRTSGSGVSVPRKEAFPVTNLYLKLLDAVSRDEEGQGLAEYALILALIAIVAIVALIFLG